MKTKTRTIDPVQQIKRDGEQAARKTAFNPVTEKLMRVGFAARGLIYFMIGLLAIQVAIGGRSGAVDQEGAIETVGRTPFGRLLLAIIIIGLFGSAFKDSC